jgi:hypothetical protein
MCFSQGPSTFIGFGYSTSRGEKINDLLKRLLPRETNIFRLILAFEKLEKKASLYVANYEAKKYEVLFGDLRLREIRESVEKRIF